MKSRIVGSLSFAKTILLKSAGINGEEGAFDYPNQN
jgi:hypothetical protein